MNIEESKLAIIEGRIKNIPKKLYFPSISNQFTPDMKYQIKPNKIDEKILATEYKTMNNNLFFI